MKLYFARHGESEANVLRVISNRGYQHPLTEHGREQARMLAKSLRGTNLTHIYTSPLQRAVETAQLVAKSQGTAYHIADALCEYDCGELENRGDAESWALHEQTWHNWMVNGQLDFCPEGGESFTDIQKRFVPFIQNLLGREADKPAEILLMAHGGIYRAMLPLVLTNIDNAFVVSHHIANASYILAEYKPDGLLCIEWCGLKIV